MSVLPVLMLRNARKNGDVEPSWTCGWIANSWIQIIMIILFCAAAVYAILSLFSLLPAASNKTEPAAGHKPHKLLARLKLCD